MCLTCLRVSDAEIKRYGRTTSAGGTTTVATPAPPSVAAVLNGAVTKGQAPTVPAQTSACSSSLAAASQQTASAPSDVGRHMGGQSHQVCVACDIHDLE